MQNGDYTVEFSTPKGYTPTKADAGNDDATDSDGLIAKGTIKDTNNWTLDSGFYKTPKYSLETMYGRTLIKMVFKILMKREFKV